MANEQNLIPCNRRSKEEVREIGRKGGIASGEARRKRKTLRESMNALLELPPASTKEFNKLVKAGIPLEEIDNSHLIVLALFDRAKTGDVQAIKELRSMIGEDTIANEETLDKLDQVLKKIEGEV